MVFTEKLTSFARFLSAVLLLPLSVALAWSFSRLLLGLAGRVDINVLPFWVGLAGYFIFQALVSRPVKVYVFGHELTHALVGIISGARLKSFKVSSNGGSVVLTKTNVLITLAPYFIPLYTVFLIILYAIGVKFWNFAQYHSYFLFLAGFSLSFHFSLTHFALKQGQRDMQMYGLFFSAVFIAIVNLILLPLILKLVFPQAVNLKQFFLSGYNDTIVIWKLIVSKGDWLWHSLTAMK